MSPDPSDSLGEMKRQCEQLGDYCRVYPPTKDETLIPGQAGAAICFGYMEAIIGLTGMMGVPSYNLHHECGRTPEGKLVEPACGHAPGNLSPGWHLV